MAELSSQPSTPSTVILVTRNGMGETYPELQQTLVTKYFQILLDDASCPPPCASRGRRAIGTKDRRCSTRCKPSKTGACS